MASTTALCLSHAPANQEVGRMKTKWSDPCREGFEARQAVIHPLRLLSL
jgi:hypothetical protein